MAKIYTKNTWVDEVLAADERYNILEDNGSAFKADMQIALSTSVTQAGSVVNASRMNNIENGVDALDTLLSVLLTGWIPASETWAYASATTITVPTGAASRYAVGDKIKLTQTTVKYFYVVAVADTVLTITGGSSYTLVSATISSNYFSKSSNPVGFPVWLSYVPTFTNLTVGSGTLVAKFAMFGRSTEVDMSFTLAADSSVGTTPNFTVPVTAINGGVWELQLKDTGVNNYVGLALASSTVCTLFKLNVTGTTITNSGVTATTPFTWGTGDVLIAHGVYGV